MPQRGAPMDIPVVDEPDRLRMHLFFTDHRACCGSGAASRRSARELAASKLGEVVFASPWLPTIVGTDTYTDELW